jgi:glycosyltransferase involved in cell wall biosynthesis
LITFIIPTLLRRKTLISTISSIKSQTVKEWNVLVGIDAGSFNNTVNMNESKTIFNHSRIEVVYVNASDSDRGACGNGAGEIRNILIKKYSKSQWIGFVDDDDNVDASYVEFLQNAMVFDSNADLVIFTMRLVSGYVVPTRRHFLKRYVLKNYVGISFAVRLALFKSPSKSIKFKASCTEDYDFIKNAFEMGYNVVLSDCIAYHVKPYSINHKVIHNPRPCNFRRLRRTYDSPPRHL